MTSRDRTCTDDTQILSNQVEKKKVFLLFSLLKSNTQNNRKMEIMFMFWLCATESPLFCNKGEARCFDVLQPVLLSPLTFTNASFF